MIEVEVVYALPQRQAVVSLTVPAGTTVAQAIGRSGIATEHALPDHGRLTVGIYGRRVAPDTVLENHDRIEIYRPLAVDPKQARRVRARKPLR